MTTPTPPTARRPMSAHDRTVAAAVAEQARRDDEARAAVHGTPPATNPDTDLPMPSPSQAQAHLVTELLDDLVATLGQGSRALGAEQIDAVTRTLTDAVVRQHGRTLRANLAELRDLGASFDRDAVAVLNDALTGPSATLDHTISLDRVRSAQQLATAAATLRTTMLRGHGA